MNALCGFVCLLFVFVFICVCFRLFSCLCVCSFVWLSTTRHLSQITTQIPDGKMLMHEWRGSVYGFLPGESKFSKETIFLLSHGCLFFNLIHMWVVSIKKCAKSRIHTLEGHREQIKAVWCIRWMSRLWTNLLHDFVFSQIAPTRLKACA